MESFKLEIHGICIMSSILSNSEKYQSGKAVKLYHVAEDFLYKLYPDAKLPEMGLSDWAQEDSSESPSGNDGIEKRFCDKTEPNNINSTEAKKDFFSIFVLREECKIRSLIKNVHKVSSIGSLTRSAYTAFLTKSVTSHKMPIYDLERKL